MEPRMQARYEELIKIFFYELKKTNCYCGSHKLTYKNKSKKQVYKEAQGGCT